MCVVFAVGVSDELLLHLTGNCTVGRHSGQQGISIVKWCAVGIAVIVGMVKLAVNGGLEALTPCGKLLSVIGMAEQAGDVRHVAQAFADEAVVGVEDRLALYVDAFGGKPVA